MQIMQMNNFGVIRGGSKWSQNDSCTSDERNLQSNQQWLLNSKDDSKVEERQVKVKMFLSANHKSEKDCITYSGIQYTVHSNNRYINFKLPVHVDFHLSIQKDMCKKM